MKKILLLLMIGAMIAACSQQGDVAEQFVRNEATYKYDGFDLVYKGSTDCGTNCKEHVYEFQSQQAGYGDRSGQMTAQVITQHRAVVRVENNAITSAVMDGQWDMIGQRLVEGQACAADVMECPDGSFVARDPNNNCEFFQCTDEVFCTADVKECPDGSFVARDPNNNCEFFPCEAVACTKDAKMCPDGSYVGRIPPNCEFAPCPGEELACTADVKECPDGSFVARDPNNNCEFFPCEPLICTMDMKECPDGSFVGRDHYNNCEFFPCPGDVVFCTADVKECPDGSFVARDPNNNCEFFACP
jgi:hypothetical protein